MISIFLPLNSLCFLLVNIPNDKHILNTKFSCYTHLFSSFIFVHKIAISPFFPSLPNSLWPSKLRPAARNRKLFWPQKFCVSFPNKKAHFLLFPLLNQLAFFSISGVAVSDAGKNSICVPFGFIVQNLLSSRVESGRIFLTNGRERVLFQCGDEEKGKFGFHERNVYRLLYLFSYSFTLD